MPSGSNLVPVAPQEPQNGGSPVSPGDHPRLINRLLQPRDPDTGRYLTLYGDDDWRRLIAALAQGRPLANACRDAGLDRDIVYWRMARDQELAAAIRHAQNAAGVDALDGVVDDVLTGARSRRDTPHPAWMAFAYKRRGQLLEHGPQVAVQVVGTDAVATLRSRYVRPGLRRVVEAPDASQEGAEGCQGPDVTPSAEAP